MRNLFIASLLLLSMAWHQVQAQGGAAIAFTPDTTYRVAEHYTKQVADIVMRDGVKLKTMIYIPKALAADPKLRVPILMSRTCYGIGPYEEGKLKPHIAPNQGLAKKGYIVVYQDVRGTGQSEGDFLDIRAFIPEKKKKTDVDEASDTYDTVEWLLKNIKGNNGKVGAWGISYPGFYTTMVGLSAHPAIKAISPQAPVSDWFRGDDFHHGGAFFAPHAFVFYRGFGFNYRDENGQRRQVNSPRLKSPFWTIDGYQYYLHGGSARRLDSLYINGHSPMWNAIRQHPDLDTFWQRRNPLQHVKRINAAVLTVGGLFDAENLYGAQQLYRSLEAAKPKTHGNHLVLGPWYHGQWGRDKGRSLGAIDFKANTAWQYHDMVETPFFEHYLRDAPKADIPEVFIFDTGNMSWQKLAALPDWNGKDAINALYPTADYGLNTSPSATANHEYVSDPKKPVPSTQEYTVQMPKVYMLEDQRFATTRPDVLTYVSEPLKASQTWVGPVIAQLKLATTATDADYVVKLIDVYPDDPASVNQEDPKAAFGTIPTSADPHIKSMEGYHILVRGEVLRARYRKSFERPEPLTPGQHFNLKIQLSDVCHTFLPGHRIMIQVQSSWFPLVERHPQQYIQVSEAKQGDFKSATHSLMLGQGGTSIQFHLLK